MSGPIVAALDDRYLMIHQRTLELLGSVPAELLFVRKPTDNGNSQGISIVGRLLRSAAVVERTFGGITCGLWDDPFEWTLPEMLHSRELVAEHLAQIEATRKRGFALLSNDDDLKREVSVAPGELKPLAALLVDALVSAALLLGEAAAAARLVSD